MARDHGAQSTPGNAASRTWSAEHVWLAHAYAIGVVGVIPMAVFGGAMLGWVAIAAALGAVLAGTAVAVSSPMSARALLLVAAPTLAGAALGAVGTDAPLSTMAIWAPAVAAVAMSLAVAVSAAYLEGLAPRANTLVRPTPSASVMISAGNAESEARGRWLLAAACVVAAAIAWVAPFASGSAAPGALTQEGTVFAAVAGGGIAVALLAFAVAPALRALHGARADVPWRSVVLGLATAACGLALYAGYRAWRADAGLSGPAPRPGVEAPRAADSPSTRE